jgi:hypothetical protein
MPISLNISGTPRSTDRLVVSQSKSQLDASKGQLQLSLRKPTRTEAFGRSIANFFTLGYYTSRQTRNQWNHIQQAALTTLDLSAPSAQDKLSQVMATYSNKRFTASRAANFLADIEAIQSGRDIQPKSPRNLDDKQNMLARGWRSLRVQHFRSMSQQAQALRHAAQNTSANDPARAHILSILRPGHAITSSAINAGQDALKAQASKQQVMFESYNISRNIEDNLPKLVDSDEWSQFSQQLESAGQAGKAVRGLFAVPLQLMTEGRSILHENHSVLLAIDPQAQKILYLDAKGNSMEDASSHYGNAGNLHQAAILLGQRVFGADWKHESGILQLTLAKQQGANDCGAFTHEFTRRLIAGQSLTDIERNFTSADRQKIRLQMAQDVHQHLSTDHLSDLGELAKKNLLRAGSEGWSFAEDAPIQVAKVAPLEQEAMASGMPQSLPSSGQSEVIAQAVSEVEGNDWADVWDDAELEGNNLSQMQSDEVDEAQLNKEAKAREANQKLLGDFPAYTEINKLWTPDGIQECKVQETKADGDCGFHAINAQFRKMAAYPAEWAQVNAMLGRPGDPELSRDTFMAIVKSAFDDLPENELVNGTPLMAMIFSDMPPHSLRELKEQLELPGANGSQLKANLFSRWQEKTQNSSSHWLGLSHFKFLAERHDFGIDVYRSNASRSEIFESVDEKVHSAAQGSRLKMLNVPSRGNVIDMARALMETDLQMSVADLRHLANAGAPSLELQQKLNTSDSDYWHFVPPEEGRTVQALDRAIGKMTEGNHWTWF